MYDESWVRIYCSPSLYVSVIREITVHCWHQDRHTPENRLLNYINFVNNHIYCGLIIYHTCSVNNDPSILAPFHNRWSALDYNFEIIKNLKFWRIGNCDTIRFTFISPPGGNTLVRVSPVGRNIIKLHYQKICHGNSLVAESWMK